MFKSRQTKGNFPRWGKKKKLPFYEYERFSSFNQLQCVFESQGKNFHSVPRKGNGESKKKK